MTTTSAVPDESAVRHRHVLLTLLVSAHPPAHTSDISRYDDNNNVIVIQA